MKEWGGGWRGGGQQEVCGGQTVETGERCGGVLFHWRDRQGFGFGNSVGVRANQDAAFFSETDAHSTVSAHFRRRRRSALRSVITLILLPPVGVFFFPPSSANTVVTRLWNPLWTSDALMIQQALKHRVFLCLCLTHTLKCHQCLGTFLGIYVIIWGMPVVTQPCKINELHVFV